MAVVLSLHGQPSVLSNTFTRRKPSFMYVWCLFIQYHVSEVRRSGSAGLNATVQINSIKCKRTLDILGTTSDGQVSFLEGFCRDLGRAGLMSSENDKKCLDAEELKTSRY